MAGALPPIDPPHAFVVEYRPLDHCFTPACRIRGRDVHGYANAVMEDGNPGAYVAQGADYHKELFLERGVILRPGESFDFDLPGATYASELDVFLAATEGRSSYEAGIAVSAITGAAPAVRVGAEQRILGSTAAFEKPQEAQLARFERYGNHVRLPLPSRAQHGLRISIVNHGRFKLAVGSPLVMRRVEGRGPRQGIIAVHDAVMFHEAEAFLHSGTHDAKADWVRAAVADRGVYFPNAQSPGQGTQYFSLRFFTGSFFAGAFGWPGMYGSGLDETLPTVLPGPIARAAELGFVTALYGNNFLILPNFGNVGFDVGYNTESNDHPIAMQRLVERWAAERPHDDALIVWWNSATHANWPPGRKGSPAPMPDDLPASEVKTDALTSTWRNLLDGADHLKSAYDALAKASPHASRITWIGSDHSSAASQKMARRCFRTTTFIATGLLHACAGTSEESNTPFAMLFDDPDHIRRTPKPIVAPEQVSLLVTWRAFESFFGIELGLPRTSTFGTTRFPDEHAPPVWDDRILVSVGCTGTYRGILGDTGYALFTPKLTASPAWTLSAGEQLLLSGGPSRSNGVMDEELFDDKADPYEYDNLAGVRLDSVVRMRREMSDWFAAHWEDHRHPRHANRLSFSEPIDLELFAPRPFTALLGDVPVRPTGDGRLARVHGKEVTILEGSDPVGIIEVRGAKTALMLKCSANGLPLDVLTPERPRFNLEVARTNCPLPAGPHDVAGPGEVLFSYEPAQAQRSAPASGLPGLGNASGPAENDELLQGMKRWGYVRDIDDKKKP